MARKGDTMTHETSAASERAAIIEAQLTACRVQRDEAIARRDALAGEVARLREELRIVSRYAARLYDDVTEVSEMLDAACYDDSPDAMCTARDRLDEALGASDGVSIWGDALKRGREDGE